MRVALSRVLYAVAVVFCTTLFVSALSMPAEARNVFEYSDTLSDSAPEAYSNHTFSFTILGSIAAGGSLRFDFPDFVVATSGVITNRNVELLVNGTARSFSTTSTAVFDGYTLTPGPDGALTYNLNSSTGLNANDELILKIGNHTSNARGERTTFSTTTGTTTLAADREPIANPGTIGTKRIPLTVTGASDTINTEFLVAVVDRVVGGPGDTTETVPPFRFNGAPTSTIGGTTLNVEISLETNELAVCKYSVTPDINFAAMNNTFTDTGQINHSTVVAVTPASLNQFYVRCIDDEDNFNIDDYIIAFTVNDQPTGTPNTEGNVEGDGTGSGNQGTGSGAGGGGSNSGCGGSGSSGGNSSGSGGSGGGSGGRTGAEDGAGSGGGFETVDGNYPSGDAEIIISGYSFPGSDVYVMVDGSVVDTTTANNDGRYSITLEEIARGAYTFGIYAVDDEGVQSTVFSTSFTVSGGRTSSLSNINIMPSVVATPDPVNPGQTLTLSGYSIPDATVTIENERDGASISRKQFTTTSDDDGFWSVTVDTDSFSQNTYKARARAVNGAISTNFSNYTFYGVGQEAEGDLNADLNTDGSVNLTDFSILLFWWGGDGGDSSPPADINRDGSVSLTDFSILLFQWTG